MGEAGGTGRRPTERILRRMLFAKPLTPGRAGRLIAATSLTLTIVGGLLVWLLDKEAIGGLDDSLWWSMQTVTTVGYGDVVPENGVGRIIGALLMMNGIALISVVTAGVTAALVEQARRRKAVADNDDVRAALARIEARLDGIEASLGDRGPRGEG